MRSWLAAIVLAASGPAGSQPLLEFREDLAFRREAVESFADRVYASRLSALSLDGRLDAEPLLLERSRRLLGRVLAAAEHERPGTASLDWQLHTCGRCGESASAAAGGRLLLGEEFLEGLALADDELGFLVAHEVAHVLAEHTREFAGVARYLVDNGLRRAYWDIQRELDASLVAQYRMAFVAEQQELEADRIALFLGARAGFDPAAMLTLLAKLDPRESGSGPATHPGAERRLQQARAALPAARILQVRALAPGTPSGSTP